MKGDSGGIREGMVMTAVHDGGVFDDRDLVAAPAAEDGRSFFHRFHTLLDLYTYRCLIVVRIPFADKGMFKELPMTDSFRQGDPYV